MCILCIPFQRIQTYSYISSSIQAQDSYIAFMPHSAPEGCEWSSDFGLDFFVSFWGCFLLLFSIVDSLFKILQFLLLEMILLEKQTDKQFVFGYLCARLSRCKDGILMQVVTV